MNDRLRTVVCIEDEPEMIELFRLILGRHNYQVFGALSGREGLETIAKVRPDVVLLDLMMPEMDGWEVYQRMRATKELEDIPVIVVTAKAQSIDSVPGLRIARVDDYITKPFGPQDLLESVNRAAGVQRSDG
jgi:DNA-binding response OmpR family regulator